MSEATQALLKISQEDRLIFLNKKKLSEIPAEREQIRKPLLKIETRLKDLETQLGKVRQRVEQRERLIQLEKEKQATSNQRMMSVSNQKEYSALQKELDGADRTIRRTEDQILELEESKTPLEQAFAADKSVYDDQLAALADQLGATDQKEQQMLSQIALSVQLVNELSPLVPADLLKEYKTLVARNITPAAIEVSSAVCHGCAMAIRPQIFNDIIKAGSGMCPTCRRMLFYKAPEEPPPAPKKKK